MIGDTVNKASRVCSKCDESAVLISKETHSLLELYSNSFFYDINSVEMKGIGIEPVYIVHKKIINSKRNTKKVKTRNIAFNLENNTSSSHSPSNN